MDKCSPKESDLIKKCLADDQDAWRDFFNQYKKLIYFRIRAVLRSMNFNPNFEELDEVFDLVVDKIFVKKSIANFQHRGSLGTYVSSLTANAVIDWVRKRTRQKRLIDVATSKIDYATNIFDVSYYGHSDESESKSEKTHSFPLMEDQAAFVKVMLIRYYIIQECDIEVLQKAATNKTVSDLRRSLAEIEQNIILRSTEHGDKFLACARAYLAVQIFDKNNDRSRKAYAREAKRRDELLDEYRKRGFEEFPSRIELAQLMGWDLNKVDRMMRKIKKSLSAVTSQKRLVPNKRTVDS